MQLDHDHCYRAIQSRDARFDGWFVTAVRTTGIYCRPSCPAITPKRANVEFFLAAATAQAHGYRACKRCRPDASPGSPEWNTRADVVGRAMRLIADGLVDRAGVPGLATRLGYSERQVHRLLTAELGAGPLALARAQRAQTARILIETTTMPITEIAFAAGFQSVRQFNDTIRDVFAASPSRLRESRRPTGETGAVTVRLATREPFEAAHLFQFLGVRAVPGVEHLYGATYRRALRLPRGNGVVALTAAAGHVTCSLHL
ncbi:MAG: DNA-3-methyladenine glycosylase 2 family protein, partial [Ilumatobacter sp.]|nr:DNA-3-methyladenine glycosylase 2 family protein [Ilumatobacter sp.]